MEKIRIALKKGEATKYVGHLDFGRAIERALRRAKLPIAYSVGFNPHMRLSFGPALGVGIASEAEYVDVEVTEPIEASVFGQRLSEKLPPDLALVAAQSVNSNASLAAELNLAAYRVVVALQPTPENTVAANEAVAAFRRAESVTYVRRSPKGIKTMDLKTYVVGDVAGSIESPVYAILGMKEKVGDIQVPSGPKLQQYSAIQPWLEDSYAMKWDGEWHITYEVFRDLGVAFAAVLVLIYVLVVAWFKNFWTPLVIMAPIPLTLVGILPGHWLFGAFFTATSMIGFIALSGIVVRNSILLIDFVQEEGSEGKELRQALVEAGSVRFRPIVLTAAAVVVGSFVMLFDPIFQGLAIAMMFGAVAATALTLVVVPLLYFELFG